MSILWAIQTAIYRLLSIKNIFRWFKLDRTISEPVLFSQFGFNKLPTARSTRMFVNQYIHVGINNDTDFIAPFDIAETRQECLTFGNYCMYFVVGNFHGFWCNIPVVWICSQFLSLFACGCVAFASFTLAIKFAQFHHVLLSYFVRFQQSHK